MTSKRLIGVAIVAILGWTTLAGAQDKPQPKNPPANPPAAAKQEPKKQEPKKEAPFCHMGSDILGAKVKNPQGEELGKVEELVIEPASGSIDYAVISFGGFLGMGDKLFAVPFTLLKAPSVPEGSRLAYFTFDVDKSRLEKAPGFDRKNWPDVAAPTFGQEIDRYYNTPRARPARAEGDDITPPASGRTDPGLAIDANQNFRLCKASELIGKDIRSPQDDDLGEIKELVLDPGRSRVNYFVMKSGGFLGIGDKLLAVPWQAVKCDRRDNKDRLVLGASKERLEKAPAFDDKDWKRMTDPAWIEDLYAYYGARPYWSASARIEK